MSTWLLGGAATKLPFQFPESLVVYSLAGLTKSVLLEDTHRYVESQRLRGAISSRRRYRSENLDL